MTNKYERVTHQGKALDRYTLYGIRAAEKALGFALTLTQGGYNKGGVKASAGTHDGGGVVDVDTDGLSRAGKTLVVRALRVAGFAAWLRTPAQGDWGEHIHAVQLGNARRSAGAKRQAEAYRRGRNGLANNGKDDGPRVKIRILPYVQSRSFPNVAKAIAATKNALEHAGSKRRRSALEGALSDLRKANR